MKCPAFIASGTGNDSKPPIAGHKSLVMLSLKIKAPKIKSLRQNAGFVRPKINWRIRKGI